MSISNYHTGVVLPLDIANVDTDNIIPKQFLQETTRSNFRKYLFFDWRFMKDKHNTINPNFILNHKPYKNSSILLSRNNFGCGSSREHAVWALIDYGFQVIIASSFADIFYKNSLNNRLLLISLPTVSINTIFQEIGTQKQGVSFTVNLYKQKIYTKQKEYFFTINDFYKNNLINNIDTIESTLQHEKIITKYESNQLIYLQ